MSLLLLLLSALLVVAHSQQVPIVTVDKELCIPTYFAQSTGNPDVDCCHYFQCLEDGEHAFIRTCMYPLVWSKEKHSCDFRRFVRSCRHTPDSCYEDPVPVVSPDCPDELDTTTECCVDGRVYHVDNDNVTYTITGDVSQTCPDGQVFNLTSCCCEGEAQGLFDSRADCLLWEFDGKWTDTFQDVPGLPGANTVFSTRGFRRTSPYAEFNRAPIAIDYFRYVDLGNTVTVMAWFRPDEFQGDLFSNGPKNESTLQFSLNTEEDEEGKRRKRQQAAAAPKTKSVRVRIGQFVKDFPINAPDIPDASSRVFNPDGSEGVDWFHVMLVLDKMSLRLLFNGQDLGGASTGEDFTQKGNKYTMLLGEGFYGAMDDFAVCRFAWSDNDIIEYLNQGNFPEKHDFPL